MAFINTRDIIGDQATLDGIVANTLTELKEDGVNRLASYALFSNQGLQYVEMPGITSSVYGDYAFASCYQLQSAVFQNMTQFGAYMFSSCSRLNYISAPNAVYGMASAFDYCLSLESVNFPNMIRISPYMFRSCVKLSDISFSPSLSILSYSAFYNCVKLPSAAFHKIHTIENSTFYLCTALSEAAFSSAVTVGAYAFYQCRKLTSVSLPSVSTINSYAFYSAPIYNLVLPRVSYIAQSAITSATAVDVWSAAQIANNAFYYNTNLFALILRSSSMTTLAHANALSGTPIEAGYGRIYVPSGLVSTYQAGTNWVTYASQIESLDNYTDVAPIGLETITDNWSAILSNSNYATDYSLGDTKWLKTTLGYMLMQIVAFDTDELADNSGYARITWITKGYYFNTSNVTSEGWVNSAVRSMLYDTVFPQIDQTVRDEIKSVKKTYAISYATYNTEDSIWLPSFRELFGNVSGQYHEDAGCIYSDFFTNNQSRIKYNAWSTIQPSQWATRSDSILVASNGESAGGGGTGLPVAFGFCT